MVGPDSVCVGVILRAHGLKGEVHLRSFTQQPQDLLSFGRLESDRPPHTIKILSLKVKEADLMLAKFAEINDRTAAEAIKGAKLYVNRALLPPVEEGQYYHADLVGLEVLDTHDHKIGTIESIYNFGAGDILEIKRVHKENLMIPFTQIAVPEVNLSGRYIRVDEHIIQAFHHQVKKPS